MEEKKLNLYLSNEKILDELCQQLTKDIGVEGFVVSVIFPSQTVFKQLFQQLFPLIQNLERENNAKLNFILNRTDISENQLKQTIQQIGEKDYAQLLTELIIKRELQKVVIRNRKD